MDKMTPEMIQKARDVKNAQELLELAKANGIELSAEEAASYFEQMNSKSVSLDDEVLEGVSAGALASFTHTSTFV